MTTLHDADKVMAGSVPAVAVYAGEVKVWPSGPPVPASASVNVLSFSLSPDLVTGVAQGSGGQAPTVPDTFTAGATLYAYYQTTGPFAERTWERWTWPLQVCWYGGQPVQVPSGWGFAAPPCPTPGTPTQIRIGHPAGAPLPGQDPPWEDPDGNTFVQTITETIPLPPADGTAHWEDPYELKFVVDPPLNGYVAGTYNIQVAPAPDTIKHPDYTLGGTGLNAPVSRTYWGSASSSAVEIRTNPVYKPTAQEAVNAWAGKLVAFTVSNTHTITAIQVLG